jgi:AcrR family transcriptional regulator
MKKRILDSTACLFEKKKFSDIKIQDIAKKSKIAKGTVFLYFKTKEEIFLKFANDEFDRMYADITKQLVMIDTDDDAMDEFLEIFENVIDEYRIFIRLLAILHIVIDHNIDYRSLYEFKKNFLVKLSSISVELERIFPYLKGKGFLLIQIIYTMFIGFENVTNPSEIARKIMETEKEFGIYLMDFKSNFIFMLKNLMIGMKSGG